MHKKVLFGKDAREKLSTGVNTLGDAVGATLGPCGRNVIVSKSYGSPMVTKDGVSVANSLTPLEDPFENEGAMLVREVASKTNDEAGDGTTTATVLAQALFNMGLEEVEKGKEATAIKRGIDMGVAAVVKELQTNIAKPVKGQDAENVAQISANSKEIGTIIYKALQSVGENGVVTVEESKTFGIETEVADGMKFDKGFLSPYFMTNPERGLAEYSDILVAVTDYKIMGVDQLIPMAEAAHKMGKKELLIICEDCSGEALSTMIVNKMKGIFNSLVIKAPGFGDMKKEILEDIAAVTGATVVTEAKGMKLENFKEELFGTVRKVSASRDFTTLVGSGSKPEEVQKRIAIIKEQIEKADSKFDTTRLKERLGKLAGGVGVIKVGAATETETKEIIQRVEDALSATKAAMEEGVVPGGGIALLKAKNALDDVPFSGTEEFRGLAIVREACEAPLRKILVNAGVDVDEVMKKIYAMPADSDEGYNAATGVFGDMFAMGIIDPAKVTRLALQNAASIADMLLTTEAVIIEIKDKTNPMM